MSTAPSTAANNPHSARPQPVYADSIKAMVMNLHLFPRPIYFAGTATSPPAPTRSTLAVVILCCAVFWFLGHATTVIQTLIYIVFSGPRNYVKTIWAILLSYGIILFKAHGIPQFATITPYLQRVMVDENTQYLLLACIWWTTKPIWVVLLPYATFSVFHAANYIRTELLPTAIPATSPLHSLSSTRLIPALTYFTQTYQASCLKAVSYLEVFFILPYLIVFVFTGRVSLFTPVIFVQFLRFRYQFSPMTREAFAELKRRADAVFLGGAYQGYYLQAVDMIERYGNVAQQQAASERRTQ